MKRFFLAVIIISFSVFSSANAAVMKNTKPLVELPYTKADQISSVLLTPISIIITGTTESPSSSWINGALAGVSDGFIASYSSLGAPLWNIRLGSNANEIATSAAIDLDGSIWITGATSASVTPNPTAIPPKALNPDNVILDPTAAVSTPLNRIKIWQISSSGNLLNSFEYIGENIINPKKLLVTDSNLIILGSIYDKSSVAGFYLSVSKSGVFTPIIKFGSKSTQINSAISNKDGSITAVGSSGELLLKVKPLSKVDAVTFKISSAGVLQQVARATLKTTSRSWSSIDAGLLQGGRVTYSNKTEAAITKFSALGKPVWNVRYSAKSSALVANGSNSWATYISSGAIKGVPAWKPKTPAPVLIEFGKKGEVISSHTLSAPAVAIAANNEIGTVVITDSGVAFGLVVVN
ncbi:hypothetical protein B1s21160_00315 [Candidatus Nanopelagicus hibericus]|uniref:Uncharacterized protein n=1 Tax=Candidatus Nanopelagicus hibericus TaxID=1884915 RepID=A0A249K7R5_9ACTN|nr:hypothetical protein [Candidatus Nanopelagicus hibericus]ASY12824.1 hypothetical protein B1s21160_00315 [Candidatus Nanopelagicus hibericus]